MTVPRIIGIGLLWGGFLAGAVAMVMKHEIDSLSPAVRTALLAVDDDIRIPRDVATKLTDKPIKEMDESEFLLSLDRFNAWWKEHVEVREKHKQAMEAAEKRGEKLAPLPAPSNPLTKPVLIKRRTELVANLWPTIKWNYYLPAVVVSLIGIVLIQMTSRPTGDLERRQASLMQLRQSLDRVVTEVQALATALPKMAPEHVVERIDDRCVLHCSDFADNRDVMKSAFGLEAFGEVMSEFASGERFLNRVWSAAADGYMEEALRSINTSLKFFQEAQQRLEGLHTTKT